MVHYKAILAYDGNRFAGFQRQKKESGERTVQAVVEKALARLGWQEKTILFAGRTDTGVHAIGQVISFGLDWKHSLIELKSALNTNLPDDIAVRAIEHCEDGFHPRYQALWRHYRYRIYYDEQRYPLFDRYAWRVWPIPDLDCMQKCSQLLLGEHDFGNFGKPSKFAGNTNRTVFLANWSIWSQDSIQGFSFDIKANAFLFHMVRRLVAYLVRVGQGYITRDEFEQVLLKKKAFSSYPLAPARGLTLIEVKYS